MNKKDLLAKLIRSLQKRKKLTLFINTVFEYNKLNDWNYIFRMSEESDCIIIDIYDNISKNRFNRYIFDFKNRDNEITNLIQNNNVFTTYIKVNNITLNDASNNLLKFIYTFSANNKMPHEYAKSFLNKEIFNILENLLKK